jgi:hypothetical protein
VLDVKYHKSGDQITVEFVQPPLAIYKGISVPLVKAVVDLKQIQLSLGGLVGMLTSITIKAAP